MHSQPTVYTDNEKGVELMSRTIAVTPEPNEEPNVQLYVLALIALARQIQTEQEDTHSAPVIEAGRVRTKPAPDFMMFDDEGDADVA